MKRCIAICLVIALGMTAPALASFFGGEDRVYVTGEMWERKWEEVVAFECEPVKYLARSSYYTAWSLLDAKGNVLMDSWFDSFHGFYEGMGIFGDNDKYGVINSQGEIVVSAQYKSIYNYSEGLAVVITEESNNGSYGGNGYIDTEGKRVLGDYYTADSFKNGYAEVGAEGSKWEGSGEYYLPAYGVIDREGNVVIDMIYDSLRIYDDGTVKASLDGVEYFFSLNIDTENPEANLWQDLIELECEPVQYLGRKGDYWSLMDANNVTLPDWLDGFDGFDENGLATVRIHGKWGLLRDDGTLAVEPNYDYIGNFCEGLARVEYSSSRGYINTSGEFATSVVFYRANDFIGN